MMADADVNVARNILYKALVGRRGPDHQLPAAYRLAAISLNGHCQMRLGNDSTAFESFSVSDAEKFTFEYLKHNWYACNLK